MTTTTTKQKKQKQNKQKKEEKNHPAINCGARTCYSGLQPYACVTGA